MIRPILRTFIFACASAFSLLAVHANAAGWSPGTPLPNLSQFGLDGTLPNLKGKVVYLDFWASWCAPCKASFPVLNRWQQSFQSKGLVVLAVSVDESPALMNAFLQKLNVSFSSVHDTKHSLIAAADVSTMPTAFLIDRKGTIREVHHGFRERDIPDLEAKLQSLLEER